MWLRKALMTRHASDGALSHPDVKEFEQRARPFLIMFESQMDVGLLSGDFIGLDLYREREVSDTWLCQFW